jgi:hypothetical protein
MSATEARSAICASGVDQRVLDRGETPTGRRVLPVIGAALRNRHRRFGFTPLLILGAMFVAAHSVRRSGSG